MRSITTGRALVTLAAGLLLGACASSDIGDILGGPGGRAPQQIQGIVRAVDVRGGDCRIELDDVRASRGLTNEGYGSRSGDRGTIYCDRDTRVLYQGQSYRPESLEVGDEVVAQVDEVGGRLMAERIDVTYDVSRDDRYGGDPYDRDRYPRDDRYDDYGRLGDEDLRATVRSVDRGRRAISLERVEFYDRDLERGSRSDLLTLYYDAETRVTFRGQSYRPENLEPGDLIAVTVDQFRGTLVASDIRVLADARDTAAYPR